MVRAPARQRAKTAAGPRAWTYAEYAAIPQDSQRYEVLWGELIVAPSPGEPHQRFGGSLHVVLWNFVAARGMGRIYSAPFDVELSPHNIVQPDVLFVSEARMGIIHESRVIGAPDLVVELLSPSTAAVDRAKKRDAYADAGVPHYWIADPRYPSIEAYQLAGDTYRLLARAEGEEPFTPEMFPGLSFTPQQLRA